MRGDAIPAESFFPRLSHLLALELIVVRRQCLGRLADEEDGDELQALRELPAASHEFNEPVHERRADVHDREVRDAEHGGEKELRPEGVQQRGEHRALGLG